MDYTLNRGVVGILKVFLPKKNLLIGLKYVVYIDGLYPQTTK